eukprot:TRINITY_DN101746_c0_g1_i1.p1 TRINITY_DN101746_c0_g1~~TRINITY_DN101746_c0_g1_i1.p1  ORF type:complete len:210 (+),score=23.62 TRINITY_DN101746_c0_g1_i1:83-712(+)
MAPSADSSDFPRTMMIRNIPTRAKAPEIMLAIDDLGFRGLYDFFYLPDRTGCDKPKLRALNNGYAFINFKEAKFSEEFVNVLTTESVSLRSSSKLLEATPARLQGLDALLEYTESAKGTPRFLEDPKTGRLVPLPATATKKNPGNVALDMREPMSPTNQRTKPNDGGPPTLSLPVMVTCSRLEEPYKVTQHLFDMPMRIPIDVDYYEVM